MYIIETNKEKKTSKRITPILNKINRFCGGIEKTERLKILEKAEKSGTVLLLKQDDFLKIDYY